MRIIQSRKLVGKPQNWIKDYWKYTHKAHVSLILIVYVLRILAGHLAFVTRSKNMRVDVLVITHSSDHEPHVEHRLQGGIKSFPDSNSAGIHDPRVERVDEGGAVDDGHAEKQADVTPDLGVEVGQGVVEDDALHLGVPPEVQIDVAHVLLSVAIPLGRHPRKELHRGAWPGKYFHF